MECAVCSYSRRLRAPIGSRESARHAEEVKSGYGMVSIALLLVAALAAPRAGRVDEGTPGGEWVIPGFSASPAAARTCGQSATPEAREIAFETVEPGDLDAEEILRLTTRSRELVSFRWNAATGELSYDTSARTGVFSDLVSSSPPSGPPLHPTCESH